jgi:hypothetical protein
MTKDYSKNKIYKIYSYLGDKIYIGSTVYEFVSQRMVKHRDSYKQWKKNNEKYMRSFVLFEEYGIENCYIELIEAKPCLDKNEQARLEGCYIRTLECVNKNIAGRTNKEYREDNKEKIKANKKQFYEKNKNKIKTTGKEYYEKNKEKIKEKVKQYREENKDKLKAKDNAYYAKNKELIKERRAKNKALKLKQ